MDRGRAGPLPITLEAPLVAMGQRWRVARRLELEVNADFHLLDVAFELKRTAAG
jgi:hypothetical protein